MVSIFLNLLSNISLLVALSVIHNMVMRRWTKSAWTYQVISGILFGAVTITGMATPLRFEHGIIFDGRSIVVSIAGFFGGPTVGIIAAAITASYRLWLGGGGALMGVCVTAESACVGIAYHYLRRRGLRVTTPLQLLGFGILVHLLMVLLMLTLPGGSSKEALRRIAPAVLTIYPIGSLLMCLLFLDQESRLKADRALRESEERYALAQRAANIGSWDWNIQTGDLRWSEQIEPMFGFEPGKFAGTYEAFMECVHPDDRKRIADAVKAAIEEGAAYDIEHRIVCPDGTERWLCETGDVIRDENGRPVRMLGVVRDVTDRKKQEEELRRKNEEMERFTYTVSHDLRSPLVTIHAFLGYVEKDLAAGDGARVSEDLAYIREAATKMAALLDELLELSRIGRKVNPPQDIPLNELIDEALRLVAGRLSQRGVTVVREDASYVLHGDRTRLLEVFQNLVDNAAKFMGDQPSPRIEIGAAQRHGETVLFVSDNGLGIDPRHHNRLFGLFEKLHPEIEGTGVGLAVVKRIVEIHGGRIWAESPGPGQGSTFLFTLANIRGPVTTGETAKPANDG